MGFRLANLTTTAFVSVLSLLSIMLLSVFSPLYGQQFGGNPPSIRWRQINTDTVRVIFPVGLEKAAQQVAQISTSLSTGTVQSIGNRIRKINIVLQNQTTVSNGYVGLGPYRSEFQLTPDPNSFSLGSLPWIQSLAIHEYRHVQQYNNFRKGFASLFYILFGEEGQALANALTVPDWFFEGDAVYQETLVSNQGRGRLPYFFNGYRALWSAGINYPYMKLRNGSLKDFVPSHYPLGYLFVAYGFEKYGNEFWKNVTADASAWKGLFYPLQKAVQKHSGKSFKQFRNEAFTFFNTGPTRTSDKPGNFLGDQEYPQWIDSASIVYMKSNYKQIPHFVILSGKQETRLRVRDIAIDNYFSYRNNKVVYSAYRPDIRWGWRDFGEIKLLDLVDGSQRNVTTKTKYFSPDISFDGSQIVAVHVDQTGSSELHLIATRDGSVAKTISNTEELYYTHPKFLNENQVVSPVRNKEGRMSIALIDIGNNSSRYLLPFGWSVIGFTSVAGNAIYFTAAYQGLDKIFRWENDRLYFASGTRPNEYNTGNYQPNSFGDSMVWTRFTANGYRLMFGRTADTSQGISIDSFTNDESNFGISVLQDSLRNFLSSLSKGNYLVSTYSKSFRLFNFHSRRPYINDPDYSFSFVSENILNTLQSEVFFNYNRNERYKQLGFSAIYGGWFPLLRLGTNYTFDRNARIRVNGPRIYWNEWETTAGVSVPLNLTKGRTYTYLTLGSDYIYNKRYFTGAAKDSFQNRAFGYINASINFSNQIQRARQHINPRFGQSINLNFKKALTNLDGNQVLAAGSLYLPGIFMNHSLVLQGAWQGRDTINDIRFSNSFPFSRGYSTNNFYRMWKLGANYHLPLVYPDWGFANIVYFLRLRANLFYDYSRIQDYTTTRQLVSLDFRSYGTEIYFDTKWWNQLPISFGFRYSRLLDRDLEGRGANQFEFVIPVNLLNR